MSDREFINNLISVYFSNATDPHQAALDNAVVNRLNDIANKLEKQEKENAKYKKLEEQLFCPLEVRLKVTHNTSIYDVEGNEYIVSHIDKEVFEVYAIFYMTFRWEHYKKTWWLKKDKSE